MKRQRVSIHRVGSSRWFTVGMIGEDFGGRPGAFTFFRAASWQRFGKEQKK